MRGNNKFQQSNHKKSNTKKTQSKERNTRNMSDGMRQKFNSGKRSFVSEESKIPRHWRMVAGTHALNEAIVVKNGIVKELWVKQGWEDSHDLRELHQIAVQLKVKIEIKNSAFLDKICPSHQGAVLLKEGGPEINPQTLKNETSSKIIFLDGIEDPHNLGAILRTSWLMGVHAVYTPQERAVGLTPTAHKVACGGVEHVPVKSVHGFDQSIKELKEQGYWVFGLSHKAEKSLFDINFPEKVVWMVGAEDKGLRTTTEKLCDELVSIPQVAANASYNASVAAAIALTETLRQHNKSCRYTQKD